MRKDSTNSLEHSPGKFTLTIKTHIVQVDANFAMCLISSPSIRTLYTNLESSSQGRVWEPRVLK